MSEFIGEILSLYLDIKYWIKHKKRRKYERENNLPKSIVWHPITKPLLFFFIIVTPISLMFFFFKGNDSEKITTKKINKIIIILEAEKKQFGKYPASLKAIIRNNPLRKNIEFDYWKTPFVYKISVDSLNYKILSLGKDKILNTIDDITATNN